MKEFVDGDKRVLNAVRDAVFELLIPRADGAHARRATKYLSQKLVVNATRRGRTGTVRDYIALKIGTPNYLERKFIAACKKAKEPFPVRKVQLRFPRKEK